MEGHKEEILVKCNQCEKEVENLKEHMEVHMNQDVIEEEMNVDDKADIQDEVWKQPKSHMKKKKSDVVKEKPVVSNKDNKSKNEIPDKENLKEHTGQHNQMSLKCNQCDKTYGNMSKLRRHDWRSHREVNCNICGEMLNSRQSISGHRQAKHQMNKIAICKYYPECIDEDECFFKHEEQNEEIDKNRMFCTEGEECSNQSCTKSEAYHKNTKNFLCRFQENCNKLKCSFKHTIERKAFLGVGSLNSKEK